MELALVLLGVIVLGQTGLVGWLIHLLVQSRDRIEAFHEAAAQQRANYEKVSREADAVRGREHEAIEKLTPEQVDKALVATLNGDDAALDKLLADALGGPDPSPGGDVPQETRGGGTSSPQSPLSPDPRRSR